MNRTLFFVVILALILALIGISQIPVPKTESEDISGLETPGMILSKSLKDLEDTDPIKEAENFLRYIHAKQNMLAAPINNIDYLVDTAGTFHQYTIQIDGRSFKIYAEGKKKSWGDFCINSAGTFYECFRRYSFTEIKEPAYEDFFYDMSSAFSSSI